MPVLRHFFTFTTHESAAISDLVIARVAAIGPTTADFLREDYGLVVHAVPVKPSADALAECLMAAK
jgi:uroporphyrinogen-III synthase